MQFSGIHTLTILDFPTKVSAIVFTPGCNMRCHFCHNAEFVLPEKLKEISNDFIPEEAILNFLDTRKGKLDGLVISGGEPTIHPDLPNFIKKVKDKGFLVKLDTNGLNSNMLKELLENNLLDYVAMDIKAIPQKYEELVNVPINFDEIKKSKELLQSSNIDFEFRTTVIKGIHTPEDIEQIAKFCAPTPKYTIQNFRKDRTLNPTWKTKTGFNKKELQELKKQAQKHIQTVIVNENL